MQWIILAIKGPNSYKKNMKKMLFPVLMKCKQFLNLIIAQSPTLAQCPSNFLFDIPTSMKKQMKICCKLNCFFYVDINDDACSPLVWWAKHVNCTQCGFFYQQIFIILVSQIGTKIIFFMVRILTSL